MSKDEGSADFVRVLVSWFLPPAGVFMQVGFGGAFWLNILLTLFFYLPGLLHAVWVITHKGPGGRDVPGGGRFVQLILAALLPPLGVMMAKGLRGAFWLNLLLTVFFWVPGMVHAAWVITQQDER